MRDPNSAVPEEATPEFWRRYDLWRAQRHLRFNTRHAGSLRRWRNRRGYRTLVVCQLVILAVAGIAAVLSYFTEWFIVPFGVAVVGSLVCQYLLRIVTGSIADTPVSALDEIQAAQRNSARSMAFIVLYSLMFVPYFILVALSTQDQVSGDAVYGTAIVLITLVLCAVMLPTLLTTWWMSDPDPEDLEVAPAYPEDSAHHPGSAPLPDPDNPDTADPERSTR
ncbi:hypothetical protein VX037_02995 [Gordonia sp. Z-3]|jgi:hypothetical protein|uniref:Uncharacterized protein n=1 Tax=Gordonia aquimaris TaxID=2984863 RepID=A0A9X3I6Q5_9ACTN|nr:MULTISPECIES: hypothetical protein [Gordonia]MCX2967092.1 hypothetical protein [Gordonia aquimaris]MED5799994.1 hypothetical protein [Gordonia sp. Z-3]